MPRSPDCDSDFHIACVCLCVCVYGSLEGFFFLCVCVHVFLCVCVCLCLCVWGGPVSLRRVWAHRVGACAANPSLPPLLSRPASADLDAAIFSHSAGKCAWNAFISCSASVVACRKLKHLGWTHCIFSWREKHTKKMLCIFISKSGT